MLALAGPGRAPSPAIAAMITTRVSGTSRIMKRIRETVSKKAFRRFADYLANTSNWPMHDLTAKLSRDEC